MLLYRNKYIIHYFYLLEMTQVSDLFSLLSDLYWQHYGPPFQTVHFLQSCFLTPKHLNMVAMSSTLEMTQNVKYFISLLGIVIQWSLELV